MENEEWRVFATAGRSGIFMTILRSEGLNDL